MIVMPIVALWLVVVLLAPEDICNSFSERCLLSLTENSRQVEYYRTELYIARGFSPQNWDRKYFSWNLFISSLSLFFSHPLPSTSLHATAGRHVWQKNRLPGDLVTVRAWRAWARIAVKICCFFTQMDFWTVWTQTAVTALAAKTVSIAARLPNPTTFCWAKTPLPQRRLSLTACASWLRRTVSRWTPPAIPSTKGELLHWIGESEVSQYYKMFSPRYFHPELRLKICKRWAMGLPTPWTYGKRLRLYSCLL